MPGLDRKAQKAEAALSRRMREAYEAQDWEGLKSIASAVVGTLPQHPDLCFEAHLNLESAEIGIAVKQDPDNLHIAYIRQAHRSLRMLKPRAVRGYGIYR